MNRVEAGLFDNDNGATLATTIGCTALVLAVAGGTFFGLINSNPSTLKTANTSRTGLEVTPISSLSGDSPIGPSVKVEHSVASTIYTDLINAVPYTSGAVGTARDNGTEFVLQFSDPKTTFSIDPATDQVFEKGQSPKMEPVDVSEALAMGSLGLNQYLQG